MLKKDGLSCTSTEQNLISFQLVLSIIRMFVSDQHSCERLMRITFRNGSKCLLKTYIGYGRANLLISKIIG